MTDFARLAAQWGIDPDYVDVRGQRHDVPEAALRNILDIVAGEAEPPARGPIPRTLVSRAGDGLHLLMADAGRIRHWRILAGAETVAAGSGLPDIRALVPGTYEVEFRVDSPEGERTARATLLQTPPEAYQAPEIGDRGVWLLAVQLYGIRSRRNWGHGDFTDLAGLLRLAADLGAAGIGLNPLHALFEDEPERASPYSPNSRMFLNPLYIDLDAVPEFPGIAALDRADAVERLRHTEFVDYTGVAALKRAGLRAAYAAFCRAPGAGRAEDFAVFCRDEGQSLSRFAAFETLRRRHGGAWWEWPPEWRDPNNAEVRRLDDSDDEVRIHKFVQWLADRQLRACRSLAHGLGLAVGLYLDVAVGVDAAGADAWGAQEAIIRQLSVGCPPDVFNPAGQDWALATFNPHRLEALKLGPFRDTIASAMRHAGAVRIDHVLGLARLYLIPQGTSPRNGAYVRYPLEALLAVIAQESVARKCLVIGEDLGTVPEHLRAALASWGIWSYLVMLFEREPDGSFRFPEQYAERALVTFSTHDLPTLAGWWSGHDLRTKRGLGLDPGETDSERQEAYRAMASALAERQIPCRPGEEFLAILRYLARTRSRLLAVAIEDVLAMSDQANIPGTVLEYPNWRRRLPVLLEDLADGRLDPLKDVLAAEGRSRFAEGAAENPTAVSGRTTRPRR